MSGEETFSLNMHARERASRFRRDRHTALTSTQEIRRHVQGVRGHHSSSREGGAWSLCRGQIFFSIQLGGSLKNSYCITCLYITVLEVSYLFYTKSAQNYLFQNILQLTPPPPSRRLNGGLLNNYNTRNSSIVS